MKNFTKFKASLRSTLSKATKGLNSNRTASPCVQSRWQKGRRRLFNLLNHGGATERIPLPSATVEFIKKLHPTVLDSILIRISRAFFHGDLTDATDVNTHGNATIGSKRKRQGSSEEIHEEIIFHHPPLSRVKREYAWQDRDNSGLWESGECRLPPNAEFLQVPLQLEHLNMYMSPSDISFHLNALYGYFNLSVCPDVEMTDLSRKTRDPRVRKPAPNSSQKAENWQPLAPASDNDIDMSFDSPEVRHSPMQLDSPVLEHYSSAKQVNDDLPGMQCPPPQSEIEREPLSGATSTMSSISDILQSLSVHDAECTTNDIRCAAPPEPSLPQNGDKALAGKTKPKASVPLKSCLKKTVPRYYSEQPGLDSSLHELSEKDLSELSDTRQQLPCEDNSGSIPTQSVPEEEVQVQSNESSPDPFFEGYEHLFADKTEEPDQTEEQDENEEDGEAEVPQHTDVNADESTRGPDDDDDDDDEEEEEEEEGNSAQSDNQCSTRDTCNEPSAAIDEPIPSHLLAVYESIDLLIASLDPSNPANKPGNHESSEQPDLPSPPDPVVDKPEDPVPISIHTDAQAHSSAYEDSSAAHMMEETTTSNVFTTSYDDSGIELNLLIDSKMCYSSLMQLDTPDLPHYSSLMQLGDSDVRAMENESDVRSPVQVTMEWDYTCFSSATVSNSQLSSGYSQSSSMQLDEENLHYKPVGCEVAMEWDYSFCGPQATIFDTAQPAYCAHESSMQLDDIDMRIPEYEMESDHGRYGSLAGSSNVEQQGGMKCDYESYGSLANTSDVQQPGHWQPDDVMSSNISGNIYHTKPSFDEIPCNINHERLFQNSDLMSVPTDLATPVEPFKAKDRSALPSRPDSLYEEDILPSEIPDALHESSGPIPDNPSAHVTEEIPAAHDTQEPSPMSTPDSLFDECFPDVTETDDN